MNLSDSQTAGRGPVVRVSAAEAVYHAIRTAIESGELAVGTKLSSEAALAVEYGVSRSVIREALRSCTALGLTATHTGKGTFVTASRPSGDLVLGAFSARSLMEARPHFEVPAAALAASRRSEEQLEELRGIVETMAAEEDPAEWVGLDSAFHAAIARASGNGVFQLVVEDVRAAMASQSETLNLTAGRKGPSDAEHRAIFDAIADADPERAGRAMAVHLHAVDDALTNILGVRP